MNTLARIFAYYKNLEQLEELIQRERFGNIYDILNISSPPAGEHFAAYALDPKYILPGSKRIELHEWQPQKFVLGFLLLETVLGKVIKTLADIEFVDDDAIAFGLNNRDIETGLNQILADLLNPSGHDILDITRLAARLREILFQFIPLYKADGLWVSPLIIKDRLAAFLQQCPEWSRNTQQPAGGKYLQGYPQRAGDAVVTGVNGQVAKAYCDWLSAQYRLAPRYGGAAEQGEKSRDRPGFRLLSLREHERLVEQEKLADSAEELKELVADRETVKIHKRRGEYDILGELLATATSVFRFCIEQEG